MEEEATKPLEQLLQAVAPRVAENVPGLQLMHPPWVPPRLKNPIVQLLQTLKASCSAVPGAQGRHSGEEGPL